MVVRGGYVFKRGRRWYAALTIDFGQGRKKKVFKSTGVPAREDREDKSGIKAARVFLESWKGEVAAAQGRAGRYSGSAAHGMTLAEFAEDEIKRRVTLGQIGESTAQNYRKAVRAMDFLADMALDAITREDVEEWERRRLARGQKTSSLLTYKITGSSFYKSAVKMGLVVTNPFAEAASPKRQKVLKNVLTEEGLQRLLTCLRAAGDTRWTVATSLALHTGMREGEICGLRWSAVDFTKGRIHVVRAARYLGEVTPSVRVGPPKTQSSYRTIPMGRDLAGQLAQWKRRQDAQHAQAVQMCGGPERASKAGLGQPQYVVGKVNGEPGDPAALSHWWARRAREWNLTGTAGRFVTFHDLRHTFITFALESGVDVVTVAALAGHASAKMTLDTYADSLVSARVSAMDQLDRLFSGNAASAPAADLPTDGGGQGQRHALWTEQTLDRAPTKSGTRQLGMT